MRSPHRQSGSVLFVVIILLLLAGVLSLLALNMSVFEQRASGNDLRTKLVSEVAEGGLAQGMEYLHQNPDLLGTVTRWSPCLAGDTFFPCGSVPAARRATMYYWNGTGGGHDFDGSGSSTGWEARMLPIAASNVLGNTGNGFTVRYGVGAVLCPIKTKALSSEATTCVAIDDAEASGTSVLTLVSVADMPDEGARTTVSQSMGSYNLLSGLTSAPPILASGSVDVTGGLQVVTNPNSGGAGVPVSVWSRKSLNKTGTPNTCYYNEFLHNASGGANGTVYLDDASPNYPLCDDCTCAGADSLSFTSSGNKVDFGIDILQNTGVNGDYTQPLASGYANYDVKPAEFPCDLFAQLFKIKAWEDDDADNFCEKKLTTTYKNQDGTPIAMGVDEAYLYENATTIINPTAATTDNKLARADQLVVPSGTDAKGNAATDYPNSGFTGLVWCQSDCNIGSNKQLGSAANPVLVVVDGSASIQGKIFGLVFMRSLAGTATLTPATGYTMSSTDISNGGNAALTMNAGAVVYGALIMQGKVAKANGTSSVVYNSDILQNLLGEDDFTKFVGVPGGWSDRTSY